MTLSMSDLSNKILKKISEQIYPVLYREFENEKKNDKIFFDFPEQGCEFRTADFQ